MYVSINDKNEIKEVGVSTNPLLTSLYIKDDDNPFIGWSDAKICCYKVKVDEEGNVTMLLPYIWTNNLDVIDMLGHASEHFEESKKAYIGDSQSIFNSDRKGIVTCSCVTESGKGIPCTYEVNGNTVIVQFEKLEEVATVTVRIQ